jgi:precorrin-6x reductase
VKAKYPFNEYTKTVTEINDKIRYERPPRLENSKNFQRVKEYKDVYEFKTTNENPKEKLFKELSGTSTLRTSGSMAILPKDYY